jgi:ATP-binding cassette subfamily F protein uup
LLLERFWFDAATQYSPIEQLSGGERRRLQLVLTLAEEPNVLLLDEPTNDLDLDTLRALEDFLEDFPGAVVAVSHDRAFLERVVDDVIVVDESTTVGRVPGGFEAWLGTRRANRRKGHASSRSENNTSASTKGATAKPDAGTGASKSTLRHRQKETEKLIRKADKVVVALTAKLADAVDHETMASLGTELSTAQASLDMLEEQWMETSLELEG